MNTPTPNYECSAYEARMLITPLKKIYTALLNENTDTIAKMILNKVYYDIRVACKQGIGRCDIHIYNNIDNQINNLFNDYYVSDMNRNNIQYSISNLVYKNLTNNKYCVKQDISLDEKYFNKNNLSIVWSTKHDNWGIVIKYLIVCRTLKKFIKFSLKTLYQPPGKLYIRSASRFNSLVN
jgi:hypothetical protein